jgi:release factor glutamine methyltransferase
MKINELLKLGKSFLKNSKTSALDAEVLLCLVLNKQKEYLISHNEESVSQKLEKKYKKLLSERKKGLPIAYLTNIKEFYGNDFYVDKRVLVPRPETEMLIDEVISLSQTVFVSFLRKQESNPIKILDVGVGSGNIAITLALKLPNAKITGIDISKSALKVAEINKNKYKLKNLKLINSDLLKVFLNHKKKFDFDIIVCNLPYIGTNDFVEENVKKYQPHLGLFAGQDGIYYYKKLLQQINRMEQKPKYIIGEYGYKHQEKELKLLAKSLFDDKIKISFKKDLAGLPRMFTLSFLRRQESKN